MRHIIVLMFTTILLTAALGCQPKFGPVDDVYYFPKKVVDEGGVVTLHSSFGSPIGYQGEKSTTIVFEPPELKGRKMEVDHTPVIGPGILNPGLMNLANTAMDGHFQERTMKAYKPPTYRNQETQTINGGGAEVGPVSGGTGNGGNAQADSHPTASAQTDNHGNVSPNISPTMEVRGSQHMDSVIAPSMNTSSRTGSVNADARSGSTSGASAGSRSNAGAGAQVTTPSRTGSNRPPPPRPDDPDWCPPDQR
jgi:hypothetical protein